MANCPRSIDLGPNSDRNDRYPISGLDSSPRTIILLHSLFICEQLHCARRRRCEILESPYFYAASSHSMSAVYYVGRSSLPRLSFLSPCGIPGLRSNYVVENQKKVGWVISGRSKLCTLRSGVFMMLNQDRYIALLLTSDTTSAHSTVDSCRLLSNIEGRQHVDHNGENCSPDSHTPV